ncbi:MAG: winged helix-turn-helix domain-containing protein [Ilumatobacter sp.]|nr:winged helix-turn-helix domain-containing protein [Ilumatobacter sp.]
MGDEGGVGVHVRILGAVGVIESGVEVSLRPNLRRLLALLVVADGGFVPLDRLAEHLADGEIDGSRIRTAVSRLRKVLGDRIETVSGGYRLRLTEHELDAARFEALRERARSVPQAEAIDLLAEALRLWSGNALEGLADLEWAAATAQRLDSGRATATEDLADALISEERCVEAAELLAAHLSEHPYRERPVALMMRALAGDGRVPDALRVFHRFRVTLRDELGLDPTADLCALETELFDLGPAERRVPDAGAPGAASSAELGTVLEAPSANLPQGATVTIMFTDIEASTNRWREDSVAMAAALAEHDRTLHEVVGAHGGRVFKHTGDGVGAVFWSASQALAAARLAQARLELPVRIGLHTGEVIERDGDLYGPTLNRCARIGDAGHGGQVLMSAVTRSVIGDELAAADVTDLGEHTLKGLARPERIFQLGVDAFAPLRVVQAPTSLPTILSSMIGRDEVIDVVEHDVAARRLTTLLGPGGIGKTRLAVSVAERLAGRFDLTVFVGLDQVSDGAEVVPAFAMALQLPVPSLANVAAALAERRTLVVIDNCEHVVDVVAEVAAELLGVVPGCHILATSREGLGVTGEHIVVVPALGADGVAGSAVELFRQRVRERDESIEFDAVELEVVLEICRRLDGLPLAIELAAARLPMLGATDLLARLTERFEILSGGRRRRLGERHRTLRATVDWSYRLLEPDERAALARLSVFATSFDLAAARAALGPATEIEALDIVTALADKSLLTVETTDGERRYRCLETIRAYGEERLDESGDATATMNAVLAYHVLLVEQLVIAMRTRSLRLSAARLQREIPNIRRSFEYCLDTGDVDAAAALITPIVEIAWETDWSIHGWAAEALALPGAQNAPSAARLELLQIFDTLVESQGGFARAIANHDLGRVLDELGGLQEVPAPLCRHAFLTMQVFGQVDRSFRALGERLDDPDGFDPNRRKVLQLTRFSTFVYESRELEVLDDWLRCLDECRSDASELVRSEVHWSGALLAFLDHDFEAMLEESEALIDLRVERSTDWISALTLVTWAEIELGHVERAVRRCDEVMDAALRHVWLAGVNDSLKLSTFLLHHVGEAEAAALLHGYLDDRRSFPWFRRSERDIDGWLDDAIPPERRAELAAQGRAMSSAELHALARAAALRHVE